MRKRLVVGVVFLVSAVIVFLLGYTEITFSLREDYMSNAAIFPATMLAILGIAQIIRVVRIKTSL